MNPQHPNRPHGHPIDRAHRAARQHAQTTKPTVAKKPVVSFIYDFFVSYSFKDRESAELLCEHLERRGYKCFVAHRDIPKGAAFAQMIPWAVEKSRVMITLLTKNFDASVHTSREVSLATEGGMPVMTVRMEDCELTGLKKYYLRDINWIDASEGVEKSCDDIEATYKRLAESNPTRIPTAAPRKPAKVYKKSLVPMMVNIAVIVVFVTAILVLLIRQNGKMNSIQARVEKTEQKDEAFSKQINEINEFVFRESQADVAEVDTVMVDDVKNEITDEKKKEIQKFNRLISDYKNIDFSKPENAKEGIEKLETIVAMIEKKPGLIEPQAGRELRDGTEVAVKFTSNEIQKAKLQFSLGKLYYYRVGFDKEKEEKGYYRKKAGDNFKKAGKVLPAAWIYDVLNDNIAQATRITPSIVKDFYRNIAKTYKKIDALGDTAMTREVEYYYKRSAVLLKRINVVPDRDTIAFNKKIEKKYMTHTDTVNIEK